MCERRKLCVKVGNSTVLVWECGIMNVRFGKRSYEVTF